MALKKLKVKNFKSFKEFEVDFNHLNVIIGANAAGKSSFVQILEFLRNIIIHGLKNAISMQGGVEYLRNINLGDKIPLQIEIVFNPSSFKKIEEEYDNSYICRQSQEATYSFSLDISKDEEVEVLEDKLDVHLDYKKIQKESNEELDDFGSVILSIINDKGKLSINMNKENFDTDRIDKLINIDKSFQFFDDRLNNIGNERLILESPYAHLIEPLIWETFTRLSIFNINTDLPKKATPISGKAELEEDGSNLAIVLRKIFENKDKERKFINLISDILPFIEDFEIEKYADKSLLFKVKEGFLDNKFIPASLLSDGTINIISLIIALYLEKKELVVFEEPERNLHPSLISKLVEMFKDASNNKQLIITTHNPEIIKFVDLESLFLVKREGKGFSIIEKPGEKEEIRIFLENNMGLDQLFIQNLLEV